MTNFNYGGYPYGNFYQPTMPQMNQPQQPNYNNINNMMNNQNQQPQANNYFYVNGIIGAKSFQMQPNQTVMLMDSDSPMCYMKQSNSMGQSTLRYFKLVEVDENDLTQDNKAKPKESAEYVVRAEFEELKQKLDDLSKRLEKPYRSDKNVEKGGNQ